MEHTRASRRWGGQWSCSTICWMLKHWTPSLISQLKILTINVTVSKTTSAFTKTDQEFSYDPQIKIRLVIISNLYKFVIDVMQRGGVKNDKTKSSVLEVMMTRTSCRFCLSQKNLKISVVSSKCHNNACKEDSRKDFWWINFCVFLWIIWCLN